MLHEVSARTPIQSQRARKHFDAQLLLVTSVSGVHRAMRRGEEADPGTAATNFGRMTPIGSLMGHLVYGLVLGVLYQLWPLG